MRETRFCRTPGFEIRQLCYTGWCFVVVTIRSILAEMRDQPDNDDSESALNPPRQTRQDFSLIERRTLRAALVLVNQPHVIEAQQIQDVCVQVVNMQPVFISRLQRPDAA